MIHVFLQVVQEAGVALGEPFLAGYGNNLPVGLVYVQKDVGLGHLIFRLGQLLGQTGHLVAVDDFSAHEYGLFHHHGSCPDVVKVGVQGRVYLLPDGIDGRSNVQAVGRGLHLGQGIQGHLAQGSVFHNVYLALQGIPEGVVKGSAGRCEALALLLADEVHVAVVIDIGTRCRDFGEVIGHGNLPVIAGHLFLDAGLVQDAALFHGHLPAVFQRKGPGLGSGERSGQNEEKRGKSFSTACHIVSIFLFSFDNCDFCTKTLPGRFLFDFF